MNAYQAINVAQKGVATPLPLTISGARVIVTSPGLNFVTLKVETAQGGYGIGDATLNGREEAVAAYLEDHVVPMLIGRDARRIEDIWQYLHRGAYWRRGPVTMRAIAAVDVALWDSAGHALVRSARPPLARRRNGLWPRDWRRCRTDRRRGRPLHDMGFKAIRAQVDDGFLKVDDTPGHGVDIDEPLAARYPYEPRQLPIARLRDGTMWNW